MVDIIALVRTLADAVRGRVALNVAVYDLQCRQKKDVSTLRMCA